MTGTEIFGALSVALLALSRVIYFASIFKGRTRPHAFSWLIWTALSGIGFAAQFTQGAGPGAWARGFSAVTCALLAVLGYYKGEKNITRGDWAALLVALGTIPLWIAVRTPVWSVVILCVIDTIGYLPTIRKSWDQPYNEASVTYFIASVCALASLFAIEQYNLSTWLYPAVLVVTNSLMGGLLLARRPRGARMRQA
ncbi:MAG TPA: hypothetical protein DCZ92_08345 [Elusimicrobia bacterium]|nr:MAG: hypothetical protein A2016_09695 [Elusimicrobia bacterium GWF2_62_30]HBA60814.1 hypothetical protein [Elusimicrobiota bacterium]